ncbi:MAG: hypothetical protein GF418_03340 [Chitinivibrionales bacterium]|nr:hypothetical protein [Chitinivibrionales bacterium]MBD3394637.1 hypothetical protein [Chitinivibrionales bacterium]
MVHAKNFTIAAIALVATLAANASAGGAEKHVKKVDLHGGHYFTVGGTMLDLENVNDAITPDGFHSISDYAVQIGGGLNWRARRLLGGAELFGYVSQKEERGTTYTKLYGIGSRMNIGFNVLPESPFLLYPQFGLGLGGLGVRLGNDEVDFDQAVAAPINNISLWQRTFVLEPGMGFEYRIPKKRPGKFLALGLRAGYAFDVSDRDDWRSDWVDITSGPDLRASGPFLRITIGKSYTRKWGKHHGHKADA